MRDCSAVSANCGNCAVRVLGAISVIKPRARRLSCAPVFEPCPMLQQTSEDVASRNDAETILRNTPFLLSRCSSDLRYVFVSEALASMRANVQAIVNLSHSDNCEGLKQAIEGRIQALANVHSLFVETRWIGAELS